MSQTSSENTSPVQLRLQSATVAYRDAQEVLAKRSEEWQKLIIEAVDHGISNARVAQIVGVSGPRVCAIVSRQASREAA